MKNNWDLKTDLPEDGSDRIIVMEIAADPDICIISVYLPCRGNNSKDKFCEVILEIEELLEKYSETHALFICGDFNSSLSRQPPNDRDQTLRDLVKKHNLHTDQDGEPTFFHASGEQSAEIDYGLLQWKERTETICKIPSLVHFCSTKNVIWPGGPTLQSGRSQSLRSIPDKNPKAGATPGRQDF
ncbi:hypothetical protein DPMN_128651 [Dreissena polymorpha]|uniref:Endonuclease/exonuclease/phosphatase domain-containing protein n=1 Tax=Dreissena polymorpha TaxID=45954 RepID=A0A9D4GZX1_DREPO|nr:hypothetical protein DPMN_128651 [Dreissena polymorpha]